MRCGTVQSCSLQSDLFLGNLLSFKTSILQPPNPKDILPEFELSKHNRVFFQPRHSRHRVLPTPREPRRPLLPEIYRRPCRHSGDQQRLRQRDIKVSHAKTPSNFIAPSKFPIPGLHQLDWTAEQCIKANSIRPDALPKP